MAGWPGASICVELTSHNFFISSTFPHRFSKNPTVFHSGRQSEGFSKVGTGVGGIVCVSGLPGRRVLGRMALWWILLTLPSRKSLLTGLCCTYLLSSGLSLSSLSLLLHIYLLLPSGREPSISSDTRTDSSTESYPYKHSHHESVVSHFSSDSQGTVIYNVENDSMSQSSRDTGRDLHIEPCWSDLIST